MRNPTRGQRGGAEPLAAFLGVRMDWGEQQALSRLAAFLRVDVSDVVRVLLRAFLLHGPASLPDTVQNFRAVRFVSSPLRVRDPGTPRDRERRLLTAVVDLARTSGPAAARWVSVKRSSADGRRELSASRFPKPRPAPHAGTKNGAPRAGYAFTAEKLQRFHSRASAEHGSSAGGINRAAPGGAEVAEGIGGGVPARREGTSLTPRHPPKTERAEAVAPAPAHSALKTPASETQEPLP